MAVGWPTKTTYANGDVYSASDVNDTNGTINLLGQSVTTSAGKNACINGGMDVWQRGTSIAYGSNTGVYTADRWTTLRTTSPGGATVTRQASSFTTIQYCARVQRDSGNTSTAIMYFGTNLESADSYRFAGQTVTLSYYARKGANYSPTSSALSANILTGTGTDQSFVTGFTGSTGAGSGTATLTTSWQRFTVTAAISSSATQIAIYYGMTPTGTAGAADYFEITGVQLELGSTATTFSRAGGTIGGELDLCQRYYLRYSADGVYSVFAASAGTQSSSIGIGFFAFPVQMRITPSSIESSTLAYSTLTNLHYALTGVTIDASTSNNKIAFVYGSGTGLSSAYGYFGANNSTSAYIGFNAEL